MRSGGAFNCGRGTVDAGHVPGEQHGAGRIGTHEWNITHHRFTSTTSGGTATSAHVHTGRAAFRNRFEDRLGQALVLLDDWAPVARPALDRDEALDRTLVGYLRGRGPATLADFAGWTKLPLSDARRAREAARDAVEQVDANRFALPEPDENRAPTSAHLLPAYDEYVLGYVDRSVRFRHDPELIVSVNGIVAPVAIVRGRIIGRWSRPTPTGTIVLEPFDALSDTDVRALEHASERLGWFLRRDIALIIAPLTSPQP